MATSAAQRVFDVTELLEKILETLNPIDLTRARIASSQVDATIASSSTLQKILFLLPATTAEIAQLQFAKINWVSAFAMTSAPSPTNTRTIATLHPAVTAVESLMFPGERLVHASAFAHQQMLALRSPWDFAWWAQNKGPRGAFLTQPPCTTLRVHARGTQAPANIVIFNSTGITVEYLGQEVFRILNANRDAYWAMSLGIPLELKL